MSGALFLASLLSAVVSLIATVTVLVCIPDVVRVVRVLSRTPVRIGAARDGDVAVRGKIVGPAQVPSVADGTALVWRRLVVGEQVGRRHHVRTDATDFRGIVVDDGSGREARIGGADPTVLSARTAAGGAGTTEGLPPALLSLVGEHVFAWPRTPKTWVEHQLREGDEVTVTGPAQLSARGLCFDEGTTVLAGKPDLLGAEEIRTFLWASGIAAVTALGGIPFLAAFR